MTTLPTISSAKLPPPMVDLLLELAVVISTKKRNLMRRKASGLTLMEKLPNQIVSIMLGLLLKLALGIGLLVTLWEVAKYQPKKSKLSKTAKPIQYQRVTREVARQIQLRIGEIHQLQRLMSRAKDQKKARN